MKLRRKKGTRVPFFCDFFLFRVPLFCVGFFDFRSAFQTVLVLLLLLSGAFTTDGRYDAVEPGRFYEAKGGGTRKAEKMEEVVQWSLLCVKTAFSLFLWKETGGRVGDCCYILLLIMT